MTVDPAGLTFNEAGLIPAVIQNAATGTVLMLGWMNRDSLAATAETGLVHFWSRSRNELWQKGATSGNTLTLVSMAADCDGDALLVSATPAGPTCHTDTDSCFDATTTLRTPFGELGSLWATIVERSAQRPPDSYTTTLLEGGVDLAGRKVAEEATEVLMAAKDHAVGGPADRLVEESADLLYHLLVLWAERGIGPKDVTAELERRSNR